MSEPIELKIERAVYGGDGLAHLSAIGHQPGIGNRPGRAVFLPLVLPGERLEATLVEEKRNFARGEMTRLLDASPQRTEPHCPYFSRCGGCQYQHAQYAAQQTMKRDILRETLTRASIPLPQAIEVLADEPWAYRNRVRFAVTPEGELAYRSRSSHALISVESCPIATPILASIAQTVARWSLANPAPAPFKELELFCNHDASSVLVTLYVDQDTDRRIAEAWLARLHSVLPPEIAGLRIGLDKGDFEVEVIASSGETSLVYHVGGVPYRVDSGAFFQVNRFLLDRFTERVISRVPSVKLAWDLYAGVGLFARQLTARCEHINAVEIASSSRQALAHNLAGTSGIAIASTTLDYLRANRERREARPDAIVLDPPRAGLGPEVTQLLNAIHAPEMVYVSCDPTTLARDLKALTMERYRITEITLVDLFPQTFHMETVVHLKRT